MSASYLSHDYFAEMRGDLRYTDERRTIDQTEDFARRILHRAHKAGRKPSRPQQFARQALRLTALARELLQDLDKRGVELDLARGELEELAEAALGKGGLGIYRTLVQEGNDPATAAEAARLIAGGEPA